MFKYPPLLAVLIMVLHEYFSRRNFLLLAAYSCASGRGIPLPERQINEKSNVPITEANLALQKLYTPIPGAAEVKVWEAAEAKYSLIHVPFWTSSLENVELIVTHTIARFSLSSLYLDGSTAAPSLKAALPRVSGRSDDLADYIFRLNSSSKSPIPIGKRKSGVHRENAFLEQLVQGNEVVSLFVSPLGLDSCVEDWNNTHEKKISYASIIPLRPEMPVECPDKNLKPHQCYG